MRLAVLGASGHGRVAADAARLAGWHEVLWFDDGKPDADARDGAPLAGTSAELLLQRGAVQGCIVAIGDNATRLRLQRELAAAGLPIATIVHPRAVVSYRARLGPGTVVLAGGIVNPGAVLDEACIVNTGATVDHDCRLGAAVHLSPGAHLGGTVHVGDRTWIGIGAAVIHGLRIGADVVVGAGAAVVNDIPDNAVVGGVPARPLHRREGGR